jgi:tetratricopeptide (TPR) repeat protein
VLRAWGVARLTASGAWDALADRHAQYYLHEGLRFAAGASGRLAQNLAEAVLLELPNVLAVHQRALEALPMRPLDAANALTAALVLEPALSLRGPHGLLLSLLDSALAAASAHAVLPPLVARALILRSSLRRDLGRLDDAELDLAQGLERALDLGDARLEGLARGHRAALFIEQTRYELAATELERALELARARGDLRDEAVLGGQRALLALERGQLDDALTHYRDATRQLAELGDRRLEAIGSGHLGSLYLELGETGDARACYQLSLSLLAGVGDLRSTALFTGYLALVDFKERRLDDAARGLERATMLLAEMGEVRFRALFDACHGAVKARQGDLEGARTLLGRADARLTALGDPSFLAAVAVHRHQLALAQGQTVPPRPRELPRDNDVRLAWVLLE